MRESLRASLAMPRTPLVTGVLRGLLALGLCSASLAGAQQTVAQGIYTCIDAKGRKLTADRPIPECADREQKVLNPSGTVKTRVGPTLTARERAEQEAAQKAEQEERARANEEKRRERALMIRYPNKTVHDRERAEALAQIGVVRQAAVTRIDELKRQRAGIDTEMEFYKKDPGKAPPALRRQIEEVANSLAVQDRFIADQDAELKRVNARFDEELVRLKQLWAPAPRSPK
jgi:hypothetical protein